MEINNSLTLKNNSGFTLIELLTVIAIIAILSTVAITAYIGTQRKAARTEAYSNLQNLRLIEEQNFAENGVYVAGAGTAALMVALPRFQPGPVAGLNYTYIVVLPPDGQGLPPAAPALTVPYNGAMVVFSPPPPAVQRPCFIATAFGNPGTRVCPDPANCDIFAIDCNNIRNFE